MLEKYVALLVLLGTGCSGYVGTGTTHDASTATPAAPPPVDAATDPEPASPHPAEDAAPDADGRKPKLRIGHTPAFADYLTDGEGRALYMFGQDLPGGEESACTGPCARDWPAFDLALDDAPELSFEAGLERQDFSRFHRQDGAWQVRYKGHPLYYRASELDLSHAQHTPEVTGDGVEQRWFVARDYLVFLSLSNAFEPAGAGASQGAYLTDGFGRTLYVCLDDTPSRSAPLSTCDGACSANRPPWGALATQRTTRLPSLLDPAELASFVRTDGITQLTYRGWPLYYFRGDAALGATEGHNQGSWRAIDPVAFGLSETN